MRPRVQIHFIFAVALFLLWAVPALEAAPLAARPADGAAVRKSAVLAAEEGAGPAHENVFHWINFGILVLGLGYLLRKPLGSFFTDRLSSIRKELDEGRRALEASQARLAAVEEKLRNFERELAEFRALSEQEMEAERERLKQTAEREAERILDFARSQIEAAARAARLDLKRYASGQALELAEALIRQRLDDAARHRLVNRFVAGLAEKSSTKN